jgi:hypothetical protein
MIELDIPDEQWDALTEQLLTAHFQHGRQALYSVIENIITNLQTICEIYRFFPGTCTRLLEQLLLPFTKEEYEERIIAPMMSLSAEHPPVGILALSLVNLRKFLGDDHTFLNNSFHREIALISGENKSALFNLLCRQLCIDAIQHTVVEIEHITNKPLISLTA